MTDAMNVATKREEMAFRRLGVFQWMSRATVICYGSGIGIRENASDGRRDTKPMSPRSKKRMNKGSRRRWINNELSSVFLRKSVNCRVRYLS